MTAEPRYLLDVNVLIALSWPQHVHHERAHAWFAGGPKNNWATTPMTEAGFVRVSSSSALIPAAVPVAAAVAAIAEMRANPGHSYLADDSSLADPAVDISRSSDVEADHRHPPGQPGRITRRCARHP